MPESAGDIARIIESCAHNCNIGSSSDRSLLRLDVKEKRRFIIVVVSAIIRPVLSIQSQLNGSLAPIVGRRGDTDSSGRVQYSCWDPYIKSCKGALSTVRNIKFTIIDSERSEVAASENNLVASAFWARSGSTCWLDDSDLRVVVVPVAHVFFGLLLSIKRHSTNLQCGTMPYSGI